MCGRIGTRTRRGVTVALAGVLMLGCLTPASARELLLRIGDLQVPAGTVVRGDAVAVGGTASVDGTVEGDAIAFGGSVEVRGRVAGSVRAEGGNVILHSTAIVDGDATAVGGTVRREPGASVGGQRAAPPPPSFPPVPLPGPPGNEAPSPSAPWWLPGTLIGMFLVLQSLFWFVHLLVLALFIGSAWLLAALFPQAIARLGAVLERDPVVAFGVGLLGWPISVMVAVLLAISVVGLTLVLLVPAALAAAIQYGSTAVALVVGHRIRPSGIVQETVVGAVILAVAFSFPGLGTLAALVVATWGLGAVLLMLVEGRWPRQAPPAPKT